MESTLSLDLSRLESKVGDYLGWGLGATFGEKAWTPEKQIRITDCIESGIRQVNNPPLLRGESEAYDWSFLKPRASLTIASGETKVALPDDFGGIEGTIDVSTDQQLLSSIRIRSAPWVYQLLASRPGDKGPPREAGVEWFKGTSLNEGQRARLVLWPASDAAYTLGLQYYILTDFLSGSQPYPYGGAIHAELYLESCLSVAELRRDDRRGIHYEQFMIRLAASVSADRRSKPQNYGYNSDNGDWDYRDRRRENPPIVTVGGVAY